MRIAGSIITAICGIVVVVGVFLAWVQACYMGYCMSFSGWDAIDMSVGDAINVLMVFVGGILMAVFAVPAFIVSLASKGGKAAIATLGILSMVAGFVAVGGAVWFMIDAAINEGFSYIAYGFYISLAAAIVGFIFAILTAAFSKGRQDW